MSDKARATIDGRIVNGELDNAGYVHVWISNGPVVGLYKITRFTDSKLTAKTLAELFTPKS